jgi:hypothetical protein
MTLLPAVLLGLALGAWLSKRIPEGTFAHGCVLFNTFAVSFGLTRLLQATAPSPWLHLLWVLPTLAALLLRSPWGRRFRRPAPEPSEPTLAPDPA